MARLLCGGIGKLTTVPTVFHHASRLEGIVPKQLGARYVSGRTRDWLKFKNPEAPEVKREAEEESGEVTDRKEAHSTHRTFSAPSISSARATASNNRPLAS